MAPANRSPRQDCPRHTPNTANPPIQLPRPDLSTRRESWNRSLPLRSDNHERCTCLESPQSRCGCVHKQPNKDVCTTIIGYQSVPCRGAMAGSLSDRLLLPLFHPAAFSYLLFTSYFTFPFLFSLLFVYPSFYSLFLFKGS